MVDEVAAPDRMIWQRLITPSVVKPILYLLALSLVITYLTRLKAQQIAMRNFVPNSLGWVHGTCDGRLQRAIDRDDGQAVLALLKVVPRTDIKDNVVERLSYDRTVHSLEAFLNSGWSPDGARGAGGTVVTAAKSGQLRAMALLLKRGANPNAVEAGRPAIFWASGFATRGAEMVRMLANAKVKIDEVVAFDEPGRARFGLPERVKLRPLSIAAQRGNVSAMRELIALGARIDAVPGEDMPPIVAAAIGMDPLSTTKTLIGAGAKLETPGAAYVRAASAPRNFTRKVGSALYFNALLDHPRTVKVLVDNGADTRAKADDGQSILAVARGTSLKWLKDPTSTKAESIDGK